MSAKTLQLRTATFVVAILLITACGGTEKTETVPAPTKAPPTQAPAATATPVPTEVPAEVPTASSEDPSASDGQPTATAAPEVAPTVEAVVPTATVVEEDESGVPFNVPIVDGAIELIIQRETGSVTYLLEDTSIDDVIEFHKTEMIDRGWDEKTSSNIGMMATLVFETDQARTSVSLQANEIAKTVNVRLFILAK